MLNFVGGKWERMPVLHYKLLSVVISLYRIHLSNKLYISDTNRCPYGSAATTAGHPMQYYRKHQVERKAIWPTCTQVKERFFVLLDICVAQ